MPRPWVACSTCKGGSWVYCDRQVSKCNICKAYFPKPGTTYADVARKSGKQGGAARSAAGRGKATSPPPQEPAGSAAAAEVETAEPSAAIILRTREAIAKLSPPEGGRLLQEDQVVLELLQARLAALLSEKAAAQPLSVKFRGLEQKLQKATKAAEVAGEKVIAIVQKIDQLKLEHAELVAADATAKDKVVALRAEVASAKKDFEAAPAAGHALGVHLDIPQCLRASSDVAVKHLVEKAEEAAAAARCAFDELAKFLPAGRGEGQAALPTDAGEQAMPPKHDLDCSQGFDVDFEDSDEELEADALLGRVFGEVGDVSAETNEKLRLSCKKQAQEWINVAKGKVRKKAGKKDL